MKNINSSPKEYRAAIETLKIFLKAEGITYKEIARELNLSESGVKKILNAQDGSVQRLADLASIVGLSLADLFSELKVPMKPVSFTEDQQNYFLKNPKGFLFYWKLVYERDSLEAVERDLGYNRKESMSVLRQLDKFLLVAVLPGDRIKIPPIRQIRWTGDGPFIRKLYREWSIKLLQAVATTNPKPGEHFMIRYVKMTQKTYDDFIQAMQSLEAEYLRRGVYEMRTVKKNLKHVRWLMASDNTSPADLG